MSRCVLAVSLAAIVAASAVAQETTTWKVVADKSKVEFVGSKPEGKHTGGFKELSGMALVAATPEESKINIEIATASLFADDDKLTNHLKSPDFFNVRKYPKITFVSTKIERHESEENKAKLTGDLTLLETTEPIELNVALSRDPQDEDVVHLMVEFSIDRTKFGMVYGEGKIDNKVAIKADLFLQKQK